MIIKRPFLFGTSSQPILKSTTTALALAILSPSVIAQEINNALNDQEETEVIAVTGVRSSLEDALNTKREAISIVDAISATDIDSLPALDLGEALQAIPGIQLNRDSGQRQSEINLRGLSGGFVKTTAEGQSFSTPSRSSGAVGSSNPFGAFEASVFDGVTVIKSPTADMQEGGIAGIIDKKLQHALSKEDGRYMVSLGGRYEELRESWDKEIKLQGSKHLIKDKLAIAFKIAGSDQNFRRDTANFSNYVPLSEDNSPGLAEYFEAHDLPENAVLRSVGHARNVTESSIGHRISFTGNIEWKPTDKLKLGTHLLYTKRVLDEGNHEDTVVSAGYNSRNPARSSVGYEVIPTGTPFLLSKLEDGTPVYGSPSAKLKNANYSPANRVFDFLETSKGVFLYGDYLGDKWRLDGMVTYSESENMFEANMFDIRHQGHPNDQYAPTGITADIDTASGNLEQASVDIDGWDTFSYEGTWATPGLSNFSSTLDKAVNQNRKVSFYSYGAVDNPTRDTKSMEFNAKHYIELNFDDVLVFESIKMGGRYAIENLENYNYTVGPGGLDYNAVITNDIYNKPLFSDTEASFFNGNYPGAMNSSNGWQSLYAHQVRDALVATRADLSDEGGVIIDPSGLYARNSAGGHPDKYGNNFNAEQAISAGYLMTNFYGELASIPYSGNMGVRYVETDNTLVGLNRVITEESDTLEPITIEQKYDNLLPSFNASFELKDDLILRTAYSQGLVRPNLRFMTPTTTVNPGENNFKIDLPKSEVEPYTADMYDLSLEWYNREGSAISVGVFQKNIENLFTRESLCPVGEDLSQYSPELGEIEAYFEAGSDKELCRETETRLNEDGQEVQRSVIINRSFNNDSEIKVTGYEIALQQKLDFLPYPWNGLGGVFNYTQIEQETDGEESLYRIAPKSYNLIGYYENDGFSLRLSYNWRDTSILQGGSAFLGPYQRKQKAGGQLDFNASYRFNSNIRVSLRGYNLNEEQRYEYIGDNEAAVSRVDFTGRTFQVGLTYTF